MKSYKKSSYKIKYIFFCILQERGRAALDF